jgi:transcriptional regulator with XRE-family HTH domain
MTETETNPKIIGERLRVTRHVLGLGPRTFAERAGLEANAYKEIESGQRTLSVEKATAICGAYGLTLDWVSRGDLANMEWSLADRIRAMRGSSMID